MSSLRRQSDRMAPLVAYVLVAVGGLIMLAPFYFMFVFASHSRTEIFSLPPPLFFGDDFHQTVRLAKNHRP